MSSSDVPPGGRVIKCEKCGVEWNPSIPPGEHVCLPIPQQAKPQPAVTTVDVQVEDQEPDGVNMVKCSLCGQMKNACLPPGSHQCLPIGKADSDDDDLKLGGGGDSGDSIDLEAELAKIDEKLNNTEKK